MSLKNPARNRLSVPCRALLFLLSVIVMTHIVKAQNRPAWLHSWETPEKPLNCEQNILHLDILGELTTVEGPPDGVLIVIARLGDGERSQELNHRRLYNVQVALTNDRRIDPKRLILTSGNRVRGDGRVEFYLGGKLMGGLRVARGKDVCVACCDIDERYYPYRKNRRSLLPASISSATTAAIQVMDPAKRR